MWMWLCWLLRPGVFLVDAYRFAFFFRIEAEVFQQQNFTRTRKGPKRTVANKKK